ncbi:NADH-quinone oxidoreductase subunit I [Egicoccus sp. AB-alg6-2]|uniref:NuoI/complex I 23 kDa subunit family protein n=1 Tax=Egicoccus sp. AB-alg6-2 TaxID=3242692 RepID=UPI00359E8103
MATTSLPGVGLLKGLGVTLKHLFKTPATQLYPHERPDLPPRTRGVIALMDENCTVCMLCSRECPDWCIYIDSHKETVPPAKEGGRARTRNVLDRFAIDFALCMYCGICVEVCPFDALFWSPEFEYAEYQMDRLLHEKGKLREWMDTVPPPPALDAGAVIPAEVSDAIAKAEKELEQAAQQAEQAAQQAEQAKAATAPAAGKARADEPKVEAGEIDQETYDALIAEGKSERIARSKAKAAYVKKQKAKLREEQAAAPAADAEAETAAAGTAEAPAAAPKPAEVHVEAGQIDQETYDALIAEGKPERMARAKAKAAWVKKEKARLREEAASGGDASQVDTPPAEPVDRTGEPEDAAGPAAEAPQPAPVETADPAEAAEPAAPQKKLGDIHVEGAGEIDQETYDALIAEGKSERIARSKAKAAWVKKKKQEQLDAGDDA